MTEVFAEKLREDVLRVLARLSGGAPEEDKRLLRVAYKTIVTCDSDVIQRALGYVDRDEQVRSRT